MLVGNVLRIYAKQRKLNLKYKNLKYMKPLIEKLKALRIYAVICCLFIPCFIAGFIGMFGVVISAPIFKLFNPNYRLPDDKAWIDVAPITSQLWKVYVWYIQKVVFRNSI